MFKRFRAFFAISVCRAIKNLGFKELWLVSPKCPLGFEAKKYAKHSEEVLRKARVVPGLKQATRGCLVVGTTGVPKRFRRRSLKHCIPLKELPARLAGEKKVALVFGSEGTGLSKVESEACDFFVSVPCSSEHSVLNLSHAIAVVLYELSSKKPGKPFYRRASKKKIDSLAKRFAFLLKNKKYVRDKRKVALAFKRVLERAGVAEDEAQALQAALTAFES